MRGEIRPGFIPRHVHTPIAVSENQNYRDAQQVWLACLIMRVALIISVAFLIA